MSGYEYSVLNRNQSMLPDVVGGSQYLLADVGVSLAKLAGAIAGGRCS